MCSTPGPPLRSADARALYREKRRGGDTSGRPSREAGKHDRLTTLASDAPAELDGRELRLAMGTPGVGSRMEAWGLAPTGGSLPRLYSRRHALHRPDRAAARMDVGQAAPN